MVDAVDIEVEVIGDDNDTYRRTVRLAGTRYQATLTIDRQFPTPHASLTANILDATPTDPTAPSVRVEGPVPHLQAWHNFVARMLREGPSTPGPSTPPSQGTDANARPLATEAPSDAADDGQNDLDTRSGAEPAGVAEQPAPAAHPAAVGTADGRPAAGRDGEGQLIEEVVQSVAGRLGRSPEEVRQLLRDELEDFDADHEGDDGQQQFDAFDNDQDDQRFPDREEFPPEEPERGRPFP